jgi:GGDEF domain-containing protein
MRLIVFLSKLHRFAILALSLIICSVVGVVDAMSGPVYSMAPFYLAPVVIAAWFVGRKAGYFISFVSALSWLVAEMVGRQYYKFDLAMYWNDCMELTLFLMTSLVVSALKGALEREKEVSRTDLLTGMPNRRHFFELVSGEIRRNHRYDEPFSIAYLDIDNFKTVNDLRGHAEGDKLLRLVAAVISAAIRETDIVARLGGDEFALLLPETARESALTALTKVQQQFNLKTAVG